MSIFNNNKLDPFGTNSLFADINKTNQQINSMNLPVQPTPQEQDYKRQRYGNMMLALSDVLKGRDPSAGVMQRQALIEAQKKEAERKAKQENILSKMSPNEKAIFGEGYAFGGEEVGYRAVQNYRNKLSSDNSTEFERNLKKLSILKNKPNLNDTEKTELNAIKTKLYGEQRVIPFFDSDGNPVNEIITNWDLKDNPTLATNLTKQGLVTVGSGPSSNFKAPINASQEISDKWESFTNEINLINDLGKLIVEGEDSITFAGKVADTLNTGIYQFKSAGRLLNFQQNDPQGYSKQINDIQNKHGSVLDKISADRGIAASLVMQLAYGLAKNVDPNARLTDRDIEAAVEMLGGSGANAKKRLATFDKLVKNRTREYDVYLDKQKLLYGKNKKVLNTINNFQTLPKFGYSSPQQNSQSADAILEELGIQ